ncbi:MAG: DNA polymerase III subunit chi [Alphaproteobacteria bacterium]
MTNGTQTLDPSLRAKRGNPGMSATPRCLSMTNKEIAFYQLNTSTLEKMLPALLEKVYQKGLRALVVIDSPQRMEAIDYALWTYSPGSFLPHGYKGNAEDHPIWLSLESSNRNQAQVVVITNGKIMEDLSGFERCVDIFDGSQETAVEQAQSRLETYRRQGLSPKFWEQTHEGRWQEKSI